MSKSVQMQTGRLLGRIESAKLQKRSEIPNALVQGLWMSWESIMGCQKGTSPVVKPSVGTSMATLKTGHRKLGQSRKQGLNPVFREAPAPRIVTPYSSS